MATGLRREREKEEIQRRILDAARELFALEGYEAVTMRKIADRVDYTPTALYFHFRDKRSLLQHLCTIDFSALAARFQVLSRVPDPMERLRMLGRGYITFALEHPHAYRLMFMTPPDEAGAADGDPDLPNPHPDREALLFLHRTVSEAMADGRLRPALNDARLVTQVLWAGLHGLASLSIAKERDAWIGWRSMEKRVEVLVDTLVRGVARGE